MPANPCNVDLKLYSADLGATNIGLVRGFRYGYIAQLVKVRSEGKKGPGCVGVKETDYFVLVEFLVPNPIAVGTAAASLVIKTLLMDGTTQRTHTFATMRPFEYSRDFSDDRDFNPYLQPFQHVGDMDSDPLTIS